MIAPIKSTSEFRPGQLVRHRRYGYRGVVVAVDPACRASAQWYQSNQTQPALDQPWYHVLVHGSQMTTYAAHTSLEEDQMGQPVAHPLVDVFFTGFNGTEYIRNQRPWPEDGGVDD